MASQHPGPDRSCTGPGRRRLRGTVLALVLGLLAGGVLAACGGDDEGGGGGGASGENKPATLNVGVIPIADVAPLYLGVEKGFFEEQQPRSSRSWPRAARRSPTHVVPERGIPVTRIGRSGRSGMARSEAN